MQTTRDIFELFKRKYEFGEFRTIGNAVQQSRTIELQAVQFEVDKPWIVREPNYDYFERELEWYKSESLNVNDIQGGAPKMWKSCATPMGYINSNYGWMIWSKDNYEQMSNCLNKLLDDPHTREACMIYQRPSMQVEYNKDGMHDFCCTYAVQCFLNEDDNNDLHLTYIVYMRSNDAVFGFNNDVLWHQYVQKMLADELANKMNIEKVICDNIIWNAGSLHIYERHFDILTDPKTTELVEEYYEHNDVIGNESYKI